MKALVIDGYNAIHKIPTLRKIMKQSLKDARHHITELARKYQKMCGGIDKVYVVFDGKDKYKNISYMASSNQIFSKTGDGDTEVIHRVHQLSRKYDVEVVTDDNFIKNNSRSYKARVTSVSKFITRLNKQQRHPAKKTICTTEDKIDQEIASKINEDLKKRWRIFD